MTRSSGDAAFEQGGSGLYFPAQPKIPGSGMHDPRPLRVAQAFLVDVAEIYADNMVCNLLGAGVRELYVPVFPARIDLYLAVLLRGPAREFRVPHTLKVALLGQSPDEPVESPVPAIETDPPSILFDDEYETRWLIGGHVLDVKEEHLQSIAFWIDEQRDSAEYVSFLVTDRAEPVFPARARPRAGEPDARRKTGTHAFFWWA